MWKTGAQTSRVGSRESYVRLHKETAAMIVSFANKETDAVWSGLRSRKLPAEIQQRALAKLAILNRAKTLEDLRNPPSNRLHALSGDREGQHSLSINMQWRVCFRWNDGSAHDVEIVDYH